MGRAPGGTLSSVSEDRDSCNLASKKFRSTMLEWRLAWSKSMGGWSTDLQATGGAACGFLIGSKKWWLPWNSRPPLSRADDAKDPLMTFFGYDPHFLDVNAGALVSSVHFDKRQKI